MGFSIKMKDVLLMMVVRRMIAPPEIPNTPTASVGSYAKYADLEPNLYNGVTSIPIPITTVNEGPLSLNVNLNYQTSAIRAHELASVVGLGWTLQSGGIITRRIRGLPDELENEYLSTGEQANNEDPDAISNSFKNDVLAGNVDGEADVFTYNVNGVSGQFVFDHTTNIHTIPSSDMDITYVNLVDEESISFKIVDPSGTQYFFGPILASNQTANTEQIVVDGDPVNNLYTSAWLLHRVMSYDGAHSININYTTDSYKYYSLQDCTFPLSLLKVHPMLYI